jgi:superfamily II DNA or RNA helicase/HKD family nuclease/diadenosine tetraphosphate (Ap4A) HIT family hydrolase
MHEDCPFCRLDADRAAFSDPLGDAIWDAFPVNPGHILIIPRRHAATWDDLTDVEKTWVWSAMDRAITVIRKDHAPEGFNVGFNLGSAAGQTIFHYHLHVIPRYVGDVEDPRGGVRHVIPAKGNYLLEKAIGKLERQRLIKGGVDPFLPHLVLHLDEADTCDIAVAFLLDSGARCIVEHLKDFLDRGGKARILVSDYLDVTEPVALRRLADLEGNLSLKVYETQVRGFHLKSYAFVRGSEGIAFVGSSNLSETALTTSLEWNYKVISTRDVLGFQQIREGFEELFNRSPSIPVTEEWIEQYERRRHVPDRIRESGIADEQPAPIPQPHSVQREALTALIVTRNEGFTAGLVVLATGLGKTWLAAFDSDRPEFRRVLFVAHREEILNQAIQVFRQIRPTARIGRLSGEQRETHADLLFASVQTLGRMPHLSQFRPDDFDYIIVDEFHHAAAGTYRRVIDFFRPKFLLGLTATPDRTDGADLLALCQENLVYEASIRDGIDEKHLCSFHYFGVPDEIDYSNIPWRNSQFDITELTAAIATEARARNALEQLRKRGGRRCIAFCCSQRHADFMTDFFVREGVRAVAVHSGANSAPRATSLEKLRDGELEVIFAVDMFNEGVDVPSIDTVLMLRPTESTIIWLQQIGRGLRIADDKDQLVIIDYIGNHRAFLMKLRGMAVIIGRDAESSGRQREILEAIRENIISLPVGCEVTYETAAIDILEFLLRPTRTEEVLETFYRDFEERNGIRPTAVETYHAGLNPRSNSDRSWFGFVDRMKGLEAVQRSAWLSAREFFGSLEKTETTRSYKIVVLTAMIEGNELKASISIEEVTARVAELVKRIHGLVDDFSVNLSDAMALERLLINNPIEAFVNARGMAGVPYFEFDGRIFRFAFDIPDRLAFTALLQEILEWRLAQYLSRGHVADVICRVSRNSSGQPILFLPSTGGGLPKGVLEIEVDGRSMEATVAKIAVNVVRAPDSSNNELPEILRAWFGDEVGLPGRSDRVRFRRSNDKIVMEPFGLNGASTNAIKLWERYPREAIPPAFGLEFSTAIWNAGFIIRPPHIFLLVTLAKDDMNPDHQYADHFLSSLEFNWQSQNRTTQISKHGQMLHNHQSMGMHVHLFVRPTKKTGQRPTSFIYCGEVDFISWEGNSPITIRWRLRDEIPQSLKASLKVPA